MSAAKPKPTTIPGAVPPTCLYLSVPGTSVFLRTGLAHRGHPPHTLQQTHFSMDTSPELKIVGAHPSWPWQSEMLAVCRHKVNVYMDLSGWAPKYIPPEVVHWANTLLQDKVLFGSDYPLIDPVRWLAEFEELPVLDAVRPKILYRNAATLLRLPVEQFDDLES